MDKGGGTQYHIIIISTDLGQESRPPWEHGVLGEPCPSLTSQGTAVITQAWGVVSITDRWISGPGSWTYHCPLPNCTGQAQSGQQV